MDTVGLLAAWAAVVSFLVGIAVTLAASFLGRKPAQWWAITNRKRAEQRVRRLLMELQSYREPADNWYLLGLVSLFATIILTLNAAIGVMIVSIQVLDVGPGLLAATLPFYVDAKVIARFTGLIMLGVTYLLILKLSYLLVKLRRQYSLNKEDRLAATIKEISALRNRFNLNTETPERWQPAAQSLRGRPPET